MTRTPEDNKTQCEQADVEQISMDGSTPMATEAGDKERRAMVEKKLLRKMDLRIIIPMSTLSFLIFLDRAIISNAKLGGIIEDLNLTPTEFSWALSILYFGYFLFDIPSNIVLRKWVASYWLSLLTLFCGIVTMCMASCTNFAGLMVTRFLLGAIQTGFISGGLYFLSLWYTRDEYGKRASHFMGWATISGASSGLIAYGISMIPTSRLNTWQWLFLLEGVPTVLVSCFTLWYIPVKPETAKFMTEEERTIEMERLIIDQNIQIDQSWSWDIATTVAKDWKTYMYTIICLFSTIALQGVTLTLPSIVAGMGAWSTVESQALTTPPYVMAFIGTLIVGYTSDRFYDRSYHLVATSLIGIVGYLLLMFIHESLVGVRYFAVCLCTIATYANTTIKFSWFENNFSGLTRRAIASATILSISNIGGVVGSFIYYDPPFYFAGNTITFCCFTAHAISVIIMRILLDRENKRRARMSPEQRQEEITKHGGESLAGDRHPDFRYVL
ncbi:MFS general substrate transporter [Lichtheimia hyalospora FSU 10163]|nr:MFS general substrate transporter [Lichtheimia hyalospora FSU 10163]